MTVADRPIHDPVILICVTEDGGVSISRLPRLEVKRRCNEQHWGTAPSFMSIEAFKQSNWIDLSSLPRATVIIIDGDIVVPQPKQVVTEYEL